MIRLVALLIAVSLSLKADAADFHFVSTTGNAVRINLTGGITNGDGDVFKAHVLSLFKQGYEVAEVALASPGGDMAASLAIGEQIRELRATTRAPTGSPQHPLCSHLDVAVNDCNCASGCFLIWAGGHARFGSVLGTHRGGYPKKYLSSLTLEFARQRHAESIATIEAYLRRMDMPEIVVLRTTHTSSSEIYYLTEAELKLVTGKPPYVEELQSARCEPGRFFNAPADCAEQVLREDRKAGAEAYLKRYQ